METITKHLRDKLHNRLGIPNEPVRNIIKGDLTKTEWSYEFERLMRNRLIMGAIRYGRLGALGKLQWDRVPDIIRRLKQYQQTGNLEHLVDCANLCLCEFVEGEHPNKHFESKDDGEHTKESE